MSAPNGQRGGSAIRAILYSTVCGAGLWATAAGVVTQHFTVAKIGAGVAVAAIVLFFGTAEARELSAQDIKTIEAVQEARNHWGQGITVTGFPNAGPCAIIAASKLADLLADGFSPDELGMAIVLDEHRDLHAVAYVQGSVNGKPWKRYLDNRLPTLADETDLFKVYGYRLRGEVSLETHASEEAR